jgi:molecular chaperone HscB
MKRIASYKKLFQVEQEITLAQLKSTYRKLVKEWHPDKFQEDNPLKSEAEKKSLEIIDAYHFLVSIAPETLEQNMEEYQETINTSMIADFQYKGLTLKVTFLNGQVFEYFAVPNNIYKKLTQSATPERFARRHIFSAHTYRMASKGMAAEV